MSSPLQCKVYARQKGSVKRYVAQFRSQVLARDWAREQSTSWNHQAHGYAPEVIDVDYLVLIGGRVVYRFVKGVNNA